MSKISVYDKLNDYLGVPYDKMKVEIQELMKNKELLKHMIDFWSSFYFTLPLDIRTDLETTIIFVRVKFEEVISREHRHKYPSVLNFIPNDMIEDIARRIITIDPCVFYAIEIHKNTPYLTYNKISNIIKNNFNAMLFLLMFPVKCKYSKRPERSLYYDIPKNLQKNELICLVSLLGGWKILSNMPQHIKNDFKYIYLSSCRSIQGDGMMGGALSEYNDNLEIMERIIVLVPHLYNNLNNELKTKEIAQRLLQKNCEIIKYVHGSFVEDESFITPFVKEHPETINMIFFRKLLFRYSLRPSSEFFKDKNDIFMRGLIYTPSFRNEPYSLLYVTNYVKEYMYEQDYDFYPPDQTLEMVLASVIMYEPKTNYYTGEWIRNFLPKNKFSYIPEYLLYCDCSAWIKPQFYEEENLKIAVDASTLPEIKLKLRELIPELFERQISLEGNYYNLFYNITSPLILTDLSGDNFQITEWFDSINLLETIYEIYPELINCDLNITTETEEISLKENPKQFYDNLVYREEETVVMVVYA